jgi:His/Glu/Gln/Arg/opine family amino acid ABC transporter permease subunit
MATEERRFGPHVGIAVLEPGEESVWARNRGVLSVLATFPAILAAVVMIALLAGADSALLVAMWKWTPFMAEGFVLNVGMSLFAIIVGTVGGVFLGMGQVSPSALTAAPSRIATQIFRNAPWLVLLFYCIFLVPFQVTVGGETFQIPNWLRASIGFTIPVIANFSEVVRGAVQSIPSGQWEAARSLGYKWSKTMFSIVLPQCIKRMIPPWMNPARPATTRFSHAAAHPGGPERLSSPGRSRLHGSRRCRPEYRRLPVRSERRPRPRSGSAGPRTSRR